MMNYGNQRNAIAQALMNVQNPQPRTQMPMQRPPMQAQITPQLQAPAPAPQRMQIPQFDMGQRAAAPAAPGAPMSLAPPAPMAPQSPMAPQMPMASPPPMDNSMGALPQDMAQYPPMGG